ncbi:hypothetical protein BDK51DRAFT_47943 [Blyttiomyces helicus]|uniref:Uncharacterized protein n=1 Tax=Blyttiomyces helicus TaxID=388810 RepID=A0A4P9W2T1_9FUNG|nr:hypothetical protein BDK51DRAFT_47943 [Blyttiomyces helicus]|eukprot:RKO85493.1 hypothetical protein BDK51DRAFT_47943 [Blyttiomyces helicus]
MWAGDQSAGALGWKARGANSNADLLSPMIPRGLNRVRRNLPGREPDNTVPEKITSFDDLPQQRVRLAESRNKSDKEKSDGDQGAVQLSCDRQHDARPGASGLTTLILVCGGLVVCAWGRMCTPAPQLRMRRWLCGNSFCFLACRFAFAQKYFVAGGLAGRSETCEVGSGKAQKSQINTSVKKSYGHPWMDPRRPTESATSRQYR